jgi:hypothetical protein
MGGRGSAHRTRDRSTACASRIGGRGESQAGGGGGSVPRASHEQMLLSSSSNLLPYGTECFCSRANLRRYSRDARGLVNGQGPTPTTRSLLW